MRGGLLGALAALLIAAVAPAQSIDFTARGTANKALARTRERLTADRTYWVHPGGSDAKDGLTGATSWQHIQYALDYIARNLDLNGRTVTIQLFAPTYTEAAVMSGAVPNGTILINGNTASPSSITWTNASGGAPDLTVTNGAAITLQGFRMTSTGAGGDTLYVTNGGFVFLGGAMDFGPTVGIHFDCDGGKLLAGANYTISGGGIAHIHANGRGMVDIQNRTVTLTGTPAFSNYFVGVSFGFVKMQGVSFVGAATGVRFIVHYTGSIRTDTHNLSFIPGDQPGQVAQGGVVDHWGEAVRFRTVLTLSANATLTIPANDKLQDVIFRNTTANAVTINVGTTAGGSDVVNGLVVPANGWISAADQAAIAKKLLNASADTTLYVSSANWNGATLNMAAIFDSLSQLY